MDKTINAFIQLRMYIEEAFAEIENTFTPQALKNFAALPTAKLITCHFSLGLWIRNTLLQPTSSLYHAFIAAGIYDKDDMSQHIIEAFHQHVRIHFHE